MHRKHVLYLQRGMSFSERFARVTKNLDADFTVCVPEEIDAYLPASDLVIYVFDANSIQSVQSIEKQLEKFPGTAALFVVDVSELEALRLPAHILADFIISDATDEELAVRLRRLLWPDEQTASTDFITIDTMSINLSTYQVQVSGKPVDFTYLEYALLAFLVTHPGHVYSRDVLLSRVWGFDYYGGSRTVDVHVRRVRAKLGTDLAYRLATVRGVGYMWEA